MFGSNSGTLQTGLFNQNSQTFNKLGSGSQTISSNSGQPTLFGSMTNMQNQTVGNTMSGSFMTPQMSMANHNIGFGGMQPNLFSTGAGQSSLLANQPLHGLSSTNTFGGSFQRNATTTNLPNLMTSSIPNPLSIQQPTSTGAENPLSIYISSLTVPKIFNNECDRVISSLNRLQSSYGYGSLIYDVSAQPFKITKENPFYSFRAVLYNLQSPHSNDDGYVIIQINRDESFVKNERDKIISILSQAFAQASNYRVKIFKTRPIDEKTADFLVYVEETTSVGILKRITSLELFSYLSNEAFLKLLSSNGMELVSSDCQMPENLLRFYFENPPSGIDPIIWEKAIKENPSPDKLIPVVVSGFAELKRRNDVQHSQLEFQKKQVMNISLELQNLTSKLSQFKTRLKFVTSNSSKLLLTYAKLSAHREVIRKHLQPLSNDEVQLRVQFENLREQLLDSKLMKDRLDEKIKQLGYGYNDSSDSVNHASNVCPMDEKTCHHFNQFLLKQQEDIADLQGNLLQDLTILHRLENIVGDKI